MKSFYERPLMFALVLAVILMMGSSVFASTERLPAMAGSPLTETDAFKALSSELKQDYDKLFKVLDTSVKKLASLGESADSPADRRISLSEKR